MPPGSSDIRGAYNQDRSRRWGLFSFPQHQGESLRRVLSSEEISLARTSIDIPGRVEWWPVLLRGALNEDQIRAVGLRPYRSAKGELIFLVNWEQGRAYFWKP